LIVRFKRADDAVVSADEGDPAQSLVVQFHGDGKEHGKPRRLEYLMDAPGPMLGGGGYVNYLVPVIFPDRWTGGRKPLVDGAVMRRLELIGREVGLQVDYLEEPWFHVKTRSRPKRLFGLPDSGRVGL